MIRLLAITVAALAATGCAVNPYADMSRAEVAWQSAHLIDVLQTADLARDPCYYENNRHTVALIGEHPSDGEVIAWGIASSYLHAQAGRWLDNTERLPRWAKTTLRAVDFAYKVDTVAGNHSIGIRIGASNKPTHPNRPAYCR